MLSSPPGGGERISVGSRRVWPDWGPAGCLQRLVTGGFKFQVLMGKFTLNKTWGITKHHGAIAWKFQTCFLISWNPSGYKNTSQKDYSIWGCNSSSGFWKTPAVSIKISPFCTTSLDDFPIQTSIIGDFQASHVWSLVPALVLLSQLAKARNLVEQEISRLQVQRDLAEQEAALRNHQGIVIYDYLRWTLTSTTPQLARNLIWIIWTY